MPSLRRAAVAAAALMAVMTTSGCVDLDEMQFRKDHRLQFRSPEDYALVTLPLRLDWTMEDFEVLPKSFKGAEAARAERREPTQDAGYFAVFVDRAPVKPGRTLQDVGDGDPLCEANPACPDKAYLEAEGVYTTRKTALTLDLVKALTSKEQVQLHQITVVLMDSDGRRIGEAAWFRYFKLEKTVFDL